MGIQEFRYKGIKELTKSWYNTSNTLISQYLQYPKFQQKGLYQKSVTVSINMG